MREALSVANSDMIQPGLLIIGNDYYVKIDQLFMKIENAAEPNAVLANTRRIR